MSIAAPPCPRSPAERRAPFALILMLASGYTHQACEQALSSILLLPPALLAFLNPLVSPSPTHSIVPRAMTSDTHTILLSSRHTHAR